MLKGKKNKILDAFSGISLIFQQPLVVLPFFLVAACEYSWLSVAYYFPRPPVSSLLGPWVRAFMGEQFMHYPLNFLVLPKLVLLGRVLIYISFGLIAQAMAFGAVHQMLIEKVKIRTWGNFNRALRRVCFLFLLAAVFGIVGFSGCKLAKIVIGMPGISRILIYAVFSVYFALMVVFEAIFIYAAAYLIFYKEGFLRSIKKAIMFLGRNFFSSVTLIFVFRLLNALIFLVKTKITYLISELFPLFPEIVLVILVFEVLFLFLSNAVIYISICRIFLNASENI
ncbi:MAG: hypothetical protein HY810_00440 [Candidatus Omnitrophica bacterium]|nr:hypothetical protein [Candidatus Omnitrophota bacterium]